jgi:hypothetical protein
LGDPKQGVELYEWPVPVKYPEQNILGFSEGLVSRQEPNSGLYGFVDQQGEWWIAPHFKSVSGFNSGLAAVKFEDQNGALHHGFVDRNGQLLGTFPGEVEAFRYGLAAVGVSNSQNQYINQHGQWVWPKR